MLSLSSLCIHPGKAAWVLYVDATCINYDGNAFDATLIAMVAALKNSELYSRFCSVKICLKFVYQHDYQRRHLTKSLAERPARVKPGYPWK